MVRYLSAVLDLPETAGQVYEIGGPEVMTYEEALHRIARVQHRPLLIGPVPLLTPKLSSRWLALVTSVNVQTATNLVESMSNEVIVRDDALRRLVGLTPTPFDEAVRQALDEREAQRCGQLAGCPTASPSCSPRPPARTTRRRRRSSGGAAPLRADHARRRDDPAGVRAHQARRAVTRSTCWAPCSPACGWSGDCSPGPVHLGRGRSGQRPIAGPLLAGAIAFGVFAVGAEAVSWIPTLHHAVDDIIRRADTGSRALIVAITIVNGIGEEVFFRGSVYSAFGRRRPALWTTVVYVAATAAAGNLMLVFAAALMGTVFALQRRATRGILAPAITHVTWATMMIFLLPR